MTEAEIYKRLATIVGAGPDSPWTVDELLAEVAARLAASQTLLLVADGPTWRHPVDLGEVRDAVADALRTMLDDLNPVPLTDYGREAVRCAVESTLEARWPDTFAVLVRPPLHGTVDRRVDVLLYPRAPTLDRRHDACTEPCDHTIVVARFGA